MRVITSSELSDNIALYLDLAKKENIVIRRGESETFYLTSERSFDEDEELDLAKAITAEELIAQLTEDIKEMFKKRAKQWAFYSLRKYGCIFGS